MPYSIFQTTCYFSHLRRQFVKETPLLGRWCLKDESKNGWKIDTANTDHCGPCSYENLKAPKTTNTKPLTLPKKEENPRLIGQIVQDHFLYFLWLFD